METSAVYSSLLSGYILLILLAAIVSGGIIYILVPVCDSYRCIWFNLIVSLVSLDCTRDCSHICMNCIVYRF
jgi:hypothetical protein